MTSDTGIRIKILIELYQYISLIDWYMDNDTLLT